MSKDKSERFVSRGNSIANVNAEIVHEVKGYQNSLHTSLAAATQPVLDLPVSLNLLLTEGRTEDVPKLTGLVKMLARDSDTLLKEKAEVDVKFEHLSQNPPKKKHKLSDHHASLMTVGAQYLALSQRAMNTVSNTLGDYMDLIDPIKTKTEEPSEA